MDHSVSDGVAGVAGASVIGIGSRKVGAEFSNAAVEVEPLADGIRPRNGQRLYSKEDVVTARGPTQNEVAVRGLV